MTNGTDQSGTSKPLDSNTKANLKTAVRTYWQVMEMLIRSRKSAFKKDGDDDTQEKSIDKSDYENWEYWLEWSPDVFALTSLILETTGWYRDMPDNDFAKHPIPKNAKVEWKHIRRAWLALMSGELTRILIDNKVISRGDDELKSVLSNLEEFDKGKPNTALEKILLDEEHEGQEDFPTLVLEAVKYIKKIISELHQTFTNQNIKLNKGESSGSWEKDIRDKIFWLHAASDEASKNFGFMSGGHGHCTIVKFLAHSFLEIRGSLSRIDRHFGVVLPKMRTPQVGLTLRSASHHLCFCRSEVITTWRTFPWIGNTEREMSVLLVPYPATFQRNAIKPVVPKSKPADGYGYFTYEPKPDQSGTAAVQYVKSLLEKAEEEINKSIDVILMPELSLSPEEFEQILAFLEQHGTKGDTKTPPVLIAGVRGFLSKSPDCKQQDDTQDKQGQNIVYVAAYFYDQWCVYEQHKHHRWMLEKQQINQYKLTLPTNKKYWENIEIPSRNVTFFMPNPWLCLCPLICEDLARSEPVSSLIRTVGPNLLVALLLDGPQLKERWSGRYAAVFADDPGCSVITLTSLGFVEQVRYSDQVPNRTISLYKQNDGTTLPILLHENESGAIITLKAVSEKEFSVDGRSDEGIASYIRIQDPRVLPIAKPNDSEVTLDTKIVPQNYSGYSITEQMTITLLSICTDVCLEATKEVLEDVEAIILQRNDFNLNTWQPKTHCTPAIAKFVAKEIQSKLLDFLKKEDDIEKESKWVTRLEILLAFIRQASDQQPRDWNARRQQWDNLVESLSKNDADPLVKKLVYWTIHNRLDFYKSQPRHLEKPDEDTVNKELGKIYSEFYKIYEPQAHKSASLEGSK